MSQTVIGIFNSAAEAQNAVSQLVNNGFSNENIDLKAGSSADYTTGTQYKDDNESGFTRFFKNLFNDDDDETTRYTQAAQRGCVVSVHAQSADDAQRASSLLDQYGAVDVDADDYDYNNKTQDYNTGTQGNNDGKTISVIEEKMQVGKREVETGGKRLRSRIVEKPVEESLRLREEHVSVQRNKVDRAASDADFNNFDEGTIELTEHKEVPVVSKEARVVEEISLGKEVEQHDEKIKDTIRKTEVDIEDIKGNNS